MTLLLLAVTLLCSHAYAQNRGSELMKQAETSLSQNEYVKARYLFLQAYSAFIQQAKKTWREDLAFGNWRVASVMPLEENLESAVTDTFMWRALFIFLLVCILIGVASFAWLRTRERRGETGVRRAMELAGPDGTVLAFGSLYMIAQIRQAATEEKK